MKKSIILIFIFGIALFGSRKIYHYYLFGMYKLPDIAMIMTIQKGDSFNKIASSLYEQGIIRNQFLFTVFAKIRNIEGQIKAGEYEVTSPTSYNKLFNLMTSGKSITYKITIPEGYNIYEIADVLVHTKIIVNKDAFIEKVFDPELLTKYRINNISFEGYMYPETYFLTKIMSIPDIIDSMVREFKKHMSPAFIQRAEEIGLSVNELITLASIIEKETSVSSERPLISSVFHNRLEQKMRLQTDPTVIYGIPNYNGNITKEDLLRATPYNTYVNYGLPIGPIANPGVESIQAALYPPRTKYLYFVAKGDGTHYFSETLEEHNKAVKRYQLGQK